MDADHVYNFMYAIAVCVLSYGILFVITFYMADVAQRKDASVTGVRMGSVRCCGSSILCSIITDWGMWSFAHRRSYPSHQKAKKSTTIRTTSGPASRELVLIVEYGMLRETVIRSYG